ncbi:MAG: hypothetical protein H0U35_01730, partial [Sporichthyaceae bacterium]|nr:hypothetical protein [Sporichthyaceae bacterium]
MSLPSCSRRDFLALSLLSLATGCTGAPDGSRSQPTFARRGLHGVRRADDVVQAYAINTKSYYASSVYRYTDGLVDLLDELGVRTVRERAVTGTSAGAHLQRS